jgi:RNA polymerase sigma factor (sigma-70 family)
MSAESLDSLLENLNKGENAAAEKVFREFEPFLRAMVRRRLTASLRVKFDSMDVVQSAWTELLEGFRVGAREFKDQAHLRAFLARVTYNHFVNECRHNSAALRREEAFRTDETHAMALSTQPRPSQEAQADELWRTLQEICPPQHRQILELKRQGIPLAEIADRVKMHEGSVRRILYDLARRLSAREAQSEN